MFNFVPVIKPHAYVSCYMYMSILLQWEVKGIVMLTFSKTIDNYLTDSVEAALLQVGYCHQVPNVLFLFSILRFLGLLFFICFLFLCFSF